MSLTLKYNVSLTTILFSNCCIYSCGSLVQWVLQDTKGLRTFDGPPVPGTIMTSMQACGGALLFKPPPSQIFQNAPAKPQPAGCRVRFGGAIGTFSILPPPTNETLPGIAFSDGNLLQWGVCHTQWRGPQNVSAGTHRQKARAKRQGVCSCCLTTTPQQSNPLCPAVQQQARTLHPRPLPSNPALISQVAACLVGSNFFLPRPRPPSPPFWPSDTTRGVFLLSSLPPRLFPLHLLAGRQAGRQADRQTGSRAGVRVTTSQWGVPKDITRSP